MYAVLERNLELVKNISKEEAIAAELLRKAEVADRNEKAIIENKIINLGYKTIPAMIDAIKDSSKSTRAIAAMVLIRMGKVAINPIMDAFKNSREQWIADYIINEIQGTQALI